MHQQDIRSGVPPALDHSHHNQSARHTMCVVVTSMDGCIQLQGGRQIRLKLGKAILGVAPTHKSNSALMLTSIQINL